jgi:hypothetical protein
MFLDLHQGRLTVLRTLQSPLLALGIGGLGLLGSWFWLTMPASVRLSCQVRAAFILDCRHQSSNVIGIPLQRALLRQTTSLRMLPQEPSSAPIYRLTLMGGSQSLTLAPFPVDYGTASLAQRAIADWQDKPVGFRQQIQFQAPAQLSLGLPLGSLALISGGLLGLLRGKCNLAHRV